MVQTKLDKPSSYKRQQTVANNNNIHEMNGANSSFMDPNDSIVNNFDGFINRNKSAQTFQSTTKEPTQLLNHTSTQVIESSGKHKVITK